MIASITDDAKIWAAFVTGGLALIGTIYAAILGHLSRKEQDNLKAATDKELARFKSETDMWIARFEAQTNKEITSVKAETDRELARVNADLQKERDERILKQEARTIVAKFRDPLLHAAYDLQSRIFNILKRSFLDFYYTAGSVAEKEYAVENTVFLVGQFLGWTELIRQEVQFLDMESDEETRELRRLQDGMYTQLQTDRFGKRFRLFAGEQRAVGELMIDRTGEQPRCIGFAAFLKNRNKQIDHWLDPMREDVKEMATNADPFEERLVGLQHSLIDMLEFLDPKHIYFPTESRGKI